jgi:hypothetical protein
LPAEGVTDRTPSQLLEVLEKGAPQIGLAPEDMEFRQEWAEKVGLGFVLPEVSDSKPGINCATCATNTEEQVCIANA